MHIIRLRDPWQPAWQKPSAVKTAGTLRRAQYQRRFNSPTGLTDKQNVWLVLQPVATQLQPSDCTFSVKLNGQPLLLEPLSHDSPSRVEPSQTAPSTDFSTTGSRVSIAAQLQSFNILEIDCPLEASTPEPPPLEQLIEVRLEIA